MPKIVSGPAPRWRSAPSTSFAEIRRSWNFFSRGVSDQFLAAPFLAEQELWDLAAKMAMYAHFKQSEGIGCDQQNRFPHVQ